MPWQESRPATPNLSQVIDLPGSAGDASLPDHVQVGEGCFIERPAMLRAAPGFRAVDGFEADDHGLVELPVATWGGWVFGHALHEVGHLLGLARELRPLATVKQAPSTASPSSGSPNIAT